MDAEYTIIIPHDDACELIAGRVPHAVMVALISAVKALTETPAEGLESAKNRRRRKA